MCICLYLDSGKKTNNRSSLSPFFHSVPVQGAVLALASPCWRPKSPWFESWNNFPSHPVLDLQKTLSSTAVVLLFPNMESTFKLRAEKNPPKFPVTVERNLYRCRYSQRCPLFACDALKIRKMQQTWILQGPCCKVIKGKKKNNETKKTKQTGDKLWY